ncbi:9103_t:CDS:2 [Entrophospora sp. SA101]|nr:3940_t:CDS:2 [Entrophospora sp. SA101]CAJ0844976.1 9103_t:CDS:2 [Entrophospora sp. SA101]
MPLLLMVKNKYYERSNNLGSQRKQKKPTNSRLLKTKKMKFPPTKEDRKPIRPCLVISDNIQNQYENGLDYPSKLQFSYPRTVDRERLKEHLGVLSGKRIGELRKA